MVIRRAKEKCRAIHPNFRKLKIKMKATPKPAGKKPEGQTFLGVQVTQLRRLTEACFGLVSRLVCELAILPMEYQSGRLVMTSMKWKPPAHYLILAVILGCAISKGLLGYRFLAQYGLTKEALLCAVSILPPLWGVIFGSANFFKHHETMELVNSWKSTLEYLGAAKGKPVSCFAGISVSLKVMVASVVVVAFQTVLLIFPFTFPHLPLHVHSLALSFGMHNFVPSFLPIQLVFFPMELLLAAVPLLATAFSAMVLIMGIDVLKVYYNGIR